MNEIDKMEKKCELMRVQSARMDLELNILKKLDEVERLKVQIENQNKREKELKSLLGE